MTQIKTTISFEVDGDPASVLRAATEQAFAEVTGELTARFDAAISGEHWPWPDSTLASVARAIWPQQTTGTRTSTATAPGSDPGPWWVLHVRSWTAVT